MKMTVYNTSGQEAGSVDASDRVFGLPMNKDLLFQVITALIANKRQTVAHTKDRGEVRGGGKKPWRQKGTGRARHGSIRSPIWKGGGVAFGPRKEKDYSKKINKKMARKALKVALSAKAKDGTLVVAEDFKPENPKTKEMNKMFNSMKGIFSNRLQNILLVTPTNMTDIVRASRNLPYLDTIEARNLNPLLVVSAKYLLMQKGALEVLEKMLA